MANRATALLAICAITIVYGSLYDWRFRVPSARDWSLFWNVVHAPSEFALNVVLYLPLGYVALAAIGRPGWAAFFGFALSAFVEAIQPFFGRQSRALDIAANAGGAAIGVAIAELARRLRGRVVLPSRPLAALAPWVLYQTYPFARDFGRPVVWLASGRMTLRDLAGTGIAWLIFFVLAAAAVPRAPRLAIAFAALLAPARPFFAGHPLSMREWVLWGVALAFALAFAGTLLKRLKRLRWCAAALALVLLAAELAPYHLASAPAEFNWTPFRALLATEWSAGTLIAARKAFEYGALVYLLGAPSRFGRATLALSAALCGLEWLQRWLPGRTPDITDPVIALMLGATMWLLPEPPRRANTLK